MTDKSFTYLAAMSDNVLAERIGAFIRHHRMARNKTQGALALEAGISRSTLSLLERGKTVNLDTLIRVLRVLDQLPVLGPFTVQESISPLILARLEKKKRKRSRGKNIEEKDETDW